MEETRLCSRRAKVPRARARVAGGGGGAGAGRGGAGAARDRARFAYATAGPAPRRAPGPAPRDRRRRRRNSVGRAGARLQPGARTSVVSIAGGFCFFRPQEIKWSKSILVSTSQTTRKSKVCGSRIFATRRKCSAWKTRLA